LTKKLVVGGSLAVLLGVGGVWLSSKENRDYAVQKVKYHLPIVLGSIAGSMVPAIPIVKRYTNKVIRDIERAAVSGYVASIR